MTTQHTLEAEALADAILKASGSGLRHYSMQKTRDAILTAAQAGIDNARADLLEALETAQMAMLGIVRPNQIVINALLKAANTLHKARGHV